MGKISLLVRFSCMMLCLAAISSVYIWQQLAVCTPTQTAGAALVTTVCAMLCQAIFLTYGKMEPRTADRVAEMLGFDAKLVMPQLRTQLTSPGAAAGASGPAGSQAGGGL